MGKASRDKGKRGEYCVRDYLRKLGWKSDRVPGSGAFAYRHKDQTLKHDVTAEKGDRTLRFEVKYKESFEAIYALYEEHCRIKQDDVLSFVCPGEKNLTVCISTSLDAVFDGPEIFEFKEKHPSHKKYKRTFEKLARMQRLLDGADILAIKSNHKPLLFLRYR